MAAPGASQPDFRALFESLPGLYLVVQPDAPRYSIVAVSDACTRATRMTREAIVGRALFEVFPTARSEAASLEQLIHTRVAAQRCSPVFGADGELAQIIVHVEEEPELRHAYEGTAQLVELAPDGIFIADLSGRFTTVNSAACRMLGYTREELLEKHVVDMIPSEDSERMRNHRERLLAGNVETAEWTGVRKDGTQFQTEVSARVLPDGRWLALVRDISERKQLEMALEWNRADLNRAQSVAKIGSWRLDIRRNQLSWSDEIYRIFDIPHGTSMTYDLFLERVHPDDRAYVDREWNAALRGHPDDIEHRLLVAGETRWVREKADLEFDEQGRLLGGVGIAQDITARKQTEKEQRRAQERLDLALEGARAATWDWNVRTGEVIFNQRWAEMRGFKLEDVKPRVDAWATGVHPDDLPRLQQALEDHFRGMSEEYRVEYRARTRSGAWIWVADLGKVFARDARGQPLRMVGVELDITERKRLEEELRIAEAKSSGIVSVSADAIISIDEQQRITLFNEGAEKIFGYSRAEALGAPVDTLMPARLRAIHGRHVARFVSEPGASRRMGERSMAIVGRRKNGEEFPADAAISKLEINGRSIVTVALRDTTEQKRVEREQNLLAEMGAALAMTLDYDETLANIARLVVRDIADLCIVDVIEGNGARRLKAVSHDPRNEWICEGLKNFPLDRSRSMLVERLFGERQTIIIDHVTPELIDSLSQSEEHRRLLRAMNAHSAVAVPLSVRGRLLGAMTFVSTTPTRAYGRGDVRLMEELARRAALAIENSRLYLAAVAALRARDEVLGIVAHDLRNPLGAILMQATRLQRPELASDAVREAGERVHRAATRMNRLIQDLLDVARVEAGRLNIDRRATATRPVVSEAIESQRARAAEGGVRLVSALVDELPEVFADRERLLQVFENLIGNALKFTPANGVVTVGASLRDANVMFWVRDTGTGIPAEQVPHVFERFWQARRSTGRGGAGLGLAIVKGIVEEHSGRIWVESVSGRGSTFFFTIPLAKPAARRVRSERHSLA